VEQWKAAHPEVSALLEPADLLVDAMRGRYNTWTRVRVNLRHVPEELRPKAESLALESPDDAMAAAASGPRQRPSRARKPS
jgi:hypothetical protein